MALTNEELQQILSGLSPEEQKALFEKLRQTYGDRDFVLNCFHSISKWGTVVSP